MLWIFAAPAGAQPSLRVDFLSVGQGDAALVTSPTGKTVLIDGGPRAGARALVAFLRDAGTGPLDLVLLTHRHADHLGGLRAAIEARGARLFMDAPFPHPSPAYAALLRTLEARGVPVREAERGRQIDLGGGAKLLLLSPPRPIISGRSAVNANSVVARLEYGRVAVLFAADAEPETERWLLRTRAPLTARVLKVAHHGSRHSSTASFLAAVRPEIAIVSVGAPNAYRHPAASTVARLERAGARVLRTDRDGHVRIETDGDHVRVRTAAPLARRAR